MRHPLRHLDELSSEESASLENCVSRFEAAWQRGERPVLDDYLAGGGPPRRAWLVELVHTDLEYRLKTGDPARVEDYLHRYPELAADRNVVLDLFAAEFELRCGSPRPCTGQAGPRYPEGGDELTVVVRAGRAGAACEVPPRENERRLGRYVLLEEIGSGSFGTVHKAFDTELRRTVAFKVPRRGGLTDARFLREARSAAALRHPGIVAVHDAGQADGVWYLVSEFVAGQTLAERLRAGRPSFRQGAEWAANLADALAHAHRHGVIHRDVKPSNILLDAEGQPRLTDFGLARHNADDGIVTEEGQMLGTPAYMSPEQARGEVRRLDARADVYSLGVVLYELLTGELPFRGNNRMLLRQVLEEEPRPPRRVNDEVPRDLETICLRAMAKEPAGRYSGATDFADDLRRFLQGQPVRARPVGAVGRLMRWGRRKPALATLTTALLLVAALGFAGVTWQWRQAETHLAEADRQRDRARENARQAHLAINDFIAIARNPHLDRSDFRDIRRQIWATGLQYYGNLLGQDDNDPTTTHPSLRADTAAAHTNVSLLQQQLGLSAQAEASFAEARRLWQCLLDEDPHNTSYQIALARTLRKHGQLCQKLGRPDDALAAYRQAVELYRGLQSRGPLADPESSLPLASFEPRTPLPDSNCVFLMACCKGMGELQERRGRLRQALDWHEQARACGESFLQQQPDSIAVRHQLVAAYRDLVRMARLRGRVDEVLQAHQRGIEIGQRLVELAPDVASYRLPLVDHQQRLGALHRAAGRNEQALLAYQQAERFLDPVLRQDPAHFDARCTQAKNRYYCCNCLHGLGRPEEALDECRRSYQLAGQLDRDHPSDPGVRTLLAEVCFWLGKLQAETDHIAEAIAAYQQGAAVYGQLARQAPADPKWRFMQGTCLHGAGNLLAGEGRFTQAADYFRRAAESREAACRDAPGNLAWHDDVAGTWYHVGEMEERLDHREAARAAYRQAIEDLRLAAEDMRKTDHRRRLREFFQSLVRVLKKQGRDERAVAVLKECDAVSGEGPD